MWRRGALWFICMMSVLTPARGIVSAQTPATPAFEIASVKRNNSGALRQGFSVPGDRFEATNVLVWDVILLAYGAPGEMLPDSKLTGGPGWLNADRFDIRAKASDAASTAAERQFMLRALLADRFKLAVHTEVRESPIYELVLAKSDRTLGRQLHRTDVDCEALVAVQPNVNRPANTAPSLFAAIEEQLSLKLELTKGPVEILVIDRVERPTDD